MDCDLEYDSGKNRWFLIDNLVNKRVRDRFVPLIVPLCIKIYVDMVNGECWIGCWDNVRLYVDDF